VLILSFSFSHQDTFSLSFSLGNKNLLNFSCSFSHLLVLVTANDITKYRVRRNHTLIFVDEVKEVLVVTRDSIICYSAYNAIAHPSVRLSVRPSFRRVDHTKTVEVRIMKFSPYGSPIPLVFAG